MKTLREFIKLQEELSSADASLIEFYKTEKGMCVKYEVNKKKYDTTLAGMFDAAKHDGRVAEDLKKLHTAILKQKLIDSSTGNIEKDIALAAEKHFPKDSEPIDALVGKSAVRINPEQ